MDGFTYIIPIFAFAAVTALVMATGGSVFGMDMRLDERLGRFRQNRTSPSSSALTGGLRTPPKKPKNTVAASAKRILPDQTDERGRLQAELMHAGIYAPWALPVFFAVKCALVVGPLVAGLVASGFGWGTTQQGLFFGAAIAGIGLILPGVWLQNGKRRRHAIFARSLPDFLDLLVTCLESGQSIEAALQRVTQELQLAHPILAGEMRVVQAQIELGATPEVAMRNFADRSDFDALRSLSSVVHQARRFGTGLAEAMRQHADELRIQREQLAEEKAQQASVKVLLPTMLLIFPAIFVVLAGPAAIQLSEMFGKADETAAHSPAGRSVR